MDRFDVANLLIASRGYQMYLQLDRLANTGFDRVKARNKEGSAQYDGATFRERISDHLRRRGLSQSPFDIVMIDGRNDHEDLVGYIDRSLRLLRPGGCLLLTDCLPSSLQQDCGAWRAFLQFRLLPDVDAFVIDTDGGVGLIRQIENALPDLQEVKSMDLLTYDDFVSNREAWMRPQAPFVLEMVAERPWGREPTVAILVIGKSEDEIESFRAASPHVEGEARMVYVANPSRRHGATAAIANPFLDEATEDVVAVVHADTTFAPGAIAVFAKAAIEQRSVTGIVGRIKPVKDNLGYLWCNAGGGFVNTLDSCSLFMLRSWGLRFDGKTFDDFHCVVEDICLQARLRGIRALVPHVEASHAGTATEPTWNDNFWRYRQRLLDKYRGHEIHTV